MIVPKRFRRRWRRSAAKLYGLAVCRWIGCGLRGLRPLWRDARHKLLALKLEDARSEPMREALGDRGVEKVYNDLLRRFVIQGSSRRMVRGDRGSQQE
jgi:hypothetical protein